MDYIQSGQTIFSLKTCNKCHESKHLYNYYPKSGICKDCQKSKYQEQKKKEDSNYFLQKLRLVPFFRAKVLRELA